MHIPLTPIRCLYRAVDLYPEKEGVVCGARRFTYAQFGSRCERLASALIADGIQTGDRVAYLSFNTHKLLEAYFGVVQARAVVMPLNVRLTPSELIQILNHSGARVLMFEPDFAPLVAEIRKACRGISRYVSLDGPQAQADLSYDELLDKGRPERTNVLKINETAPAELFYTSGSTGTPKGVVLSHRTLYLHALSVGLSDYTPDTGIDLHTVPLFHANGWGQPHLCTMVGRKQVMVRRFDPATVFRLIQEERATTMILVPIMAGALLMSPERGNYDLSSLQRISLGGAATSPEMIDRLEKAFSCEARAGYGLTETSPVVSGARKKGTVTYNDNTDRLRHQAAAGWPIPGVEVRVVDTEMRDVPRDEETMGEIVIRGDVVMDGYYREPAATDAVMSGAWLQTGDMAVWDSENYIYIVDRKKDIIISGGENISSVEVEHAIAAFPAVMECAVVASPDEKWGEVPVAFVVPKPGETVTEQQLTEFLEGRLGKFKWPRVWHIAGDPLPKTGTGKVLKRELRESFWRDKTKRVQG